MSLRLSLQRPCASGEGRLIAQERERLSSGFSGRFEEDHAQWHRIRYQFDLYQQRAESALQLPASIALWLLNRLPLNTHFHCHLPANCTGAGQAFESNSDQNNSRPSPAEVDAELTVKFLRKGVPWRPDGVLCKNVTPQHSDESVHHSVSR